MGSSCEIQIEGMRSLMNDGATTGTNNEGANGGNSSIRRKLMLILATSLAIIPGASAGFVFIRTSSITSGETERSARDLANLLADAVQTFGQTGDMTGLSIFLKNAGQ